MKPIAFGNGVRIEARLAERRLRIERRCVDTAEDKEISSIALCSKLMKSARERLGPAPVDFGKRKMESNKWDVTGYTVERDETM